MYFCHLILRSGNRIVKVSSTIVKLNHNSVTHLSWRLFFCRPLHWQSNCTACAFFFFFLQKRTEDPWVVCTKYIHVTSSGLPISKSRWKRERLKGRGGERERERERERETARLEAFWSLPPAHWPDWGQVSPQCLGEPQLYTGRQIHTHTHSWGYQLLDSKRREPSTHFHKIMHS